jgi:outer membrane protein assembly factor BamB
MSPKYLFLCSWLACVAGTAAAQPQSGRFESLGIPVRVGGLMGCVVGPNGRGSEALYFNFNQAGAPLFLVQVDPDTGEAHQFNAPEGPGAWALIVGPDEKIYLGTWDGGLILRFDPRQPEKGIAVVGKPSASEEYLWQYALGKDGKLYACTYPNAKLVSFDPSTGKMDDLGRMHPTEMYARSVAAGPNGKIYVGIGTTKGDLVVFDPATRMHRSILPDGLRGNPAWNAVGVSRRSDGLVYATYGTNLLRIEDETVTCVATAPDVPPLKLRDGRVVTAFGRGSFSLRNPGTGQVVERTFKYAGAGDMIFVVGMGPGGAIYGSTAMPLEIFRFDPRAGKSEHLGGMPGGEVYSMLPEKGKLYLCYYGGAIMNLYDPAKPFWKFGAGADCNPITFGGVGDGHLRPRAMIRGPGGMIYIGSEPPYGQLGGALGVWDPKLNKTIENYRNLVTNQSIVSLAYEPKSGLIFGGSGNWGGGGTHPTEKEAKFFAFDPKQKRKVFEAALVPGAGSYSATEAAVGKVFTTVGDRLFVFDPQTMQVVRTNTLPGAQAQISLGRHRSGLLVGLTSGGVYAFDPLKGEVVHTASAPTHIHCGFALTDEAVYFGSGPTLWQYLLPPLPTATRQDRSER